MGCEQRHKEQGEGDHFSMLWQLQVLRRVLNGMPENTKARVNQFFCCLQTEWSLEALVFKGVSSS